MIVLAFLVLPVNRNRTGLLTLVPLLVTQVLVFLMNAISPTFEYAASLINLVVVGLGVLWLLTPYLTSVPRAGKYFAATLILAFAVGITALLDSGLDWSGEMTALAICGLLANIAVMAGCALALRFCRDRITFGWFILWLLLWLPVSALAVGLIGSVIVAIIMLIATGEVGMLMIAVGGMIFSLVAGVIIYVCLLPYLGLVFWIRACRERFLVFFSTPAKN